MAASAQSLATLVLWRFLQGLGASSGSVLARAIVLDRWRGEQASRVLSWMAIVTFLSPVLAPLVGGQIAALGALADDLLGPCRGRRSSVSPSRSAPCGSTERESASRLLQRVAAYGVDPARPSRPSGYMALHGARASSASCR